jgi:hypothetical protein
MEQFEKILLVMLNLFLQNYKMGHGSWAIFQDTYKHVLII